MWHIRRLFLVGRQELIFKFTRICFPWRSHYLKAWESCSKDYSYSLVVEPLWRMLAANFK